MKTGRRENGDIRVGKIGALIAAIAGLIALFGVLVSWGADKTNVVRDVLANTQGRIQHSAKLVKMEERHAASEIDMQEMKTDFVKAVGDMKVINAEFKGDVKAVQASLDTLNQYLKDMKK